MEHHIKILKWLDIFLRPNSLYHLESILCTLSVGYVIGVV